MSLNWHQAIAEANSTLVNAGGPAALWGALEYDIGAPHHVYKTFTRVGPGAEIEH